MPTISDIFGPLFSGDTSGTGGFDNKFLKNLLGQALRFSSQEEIDPYMEVGSADDIENVNPYTRKAWEKLLAGTGAQQEAPSMEGTTPITLQNLLKAGAGGGFKRQASDLLKSLNASPTDLTGDARGGVESSLLSLLGGELPDFMQGIADTAASAAQSPYSAQNALYSGAASRAGSEAAAKAVGEQTNQYLSTLMGGMSNLSGIQAGQQQAQLGAESGLLGQLLGSRSGMAGNWMQAATGLEGTELSSNAALQQAFGQMGVEERMNALSNLAGMGKQEYFNPSYVQNPFFLSPMMAWGADKSQEMGMLSSIAGGLGAGVNLASIGA